MHVGFLVIGIIISHTWIYKYTGAIPTVTLTVSSSPYFDIGGSISFTCAINENLSINNVYLKKDGVDYVWILINNSSSCVFYKRQPSTDHHSYNIACDQRMTVHIEMNRADYTDHDVEWKCQMSSESATCITPCISTYGVRTVQRVPVSSVQLSNGTGQLLVTPVLVLDGSSKDFRCNTSSNGSRPRALFNWYKRLDKQSPILIEDQSISTPGPSKPEADLSIYISYSILTLIGNRSYQNMYIWCEARDETNRGNFSKSKEAQLNIVYPPVVQLFPNNSTCNVTKGSPKFVLLCNVTDANPMPQPDDYSWFFGGTVIQGQTTSSYELLNVQKSQAGVYQCMARNGYGTGSSSTTNLNVQYGPTISLIHYTEVEEGENVSITCNVTANPKPDIVWSTNGTVILPSSNTLRIPYISKLNDGNYTCTANNVLYPTGQSSVPQTAMDMLRINVLYGPGSNIYLTPNVSVYEVEEGQKAANIVCMATCNPACTYRWLKVNGQMHSSNTLSLGIVQKKANGNYICEAFNTILGQQRGSNISVTFIIKYAPVVKLQAVVRDVNPYRVKQGHENVSLVCEVVDAYPQPTLLVWTHNGNELQGESRSTFSIPVATRQINGTWGCKGLNGYGKPIESQLQVDVQYGPVIGPFTNKTVIEGQMFSVTCNIDSNPLPESVSWTKDNNATFSHNATVLTIANARRYDSGTYRCTALNWIHPSGQNEESLSGMKWFYLSVQLPETRSSPISAIAGGVAGGIVVILLVGICIIFWRRYQHNKKSGDGLVDNPVYDSSDVNPGQLVEYATVDKCKKRSSQKEDLSNVYAQVDKTTKTGHNREMYENATICKKSSDKGNVNENPRNSQAEASCENVYENPGASTSNETRMNKYGLIYADLMLHPPTKKNGKPVIRGLETRTEYVEIAYGKKEEPHPHDDGEMEHNSITKVKREK